MNRRQQVRLALLIRRVEERLLALFAEGKLNGTLHTCIGQEWSAVAVMNALAPEDWVFSNHRGHGHFLARTGDVAGLIAEVMGKETGACGGHGGSQHLRAERYHSNGVLGGMSPIAAGAALAGKLANDGSIAVVFLGDGALGEGLVYESLNITSKWQLPLLIVVENNHYAQSTSSSQTFAGTVCDRAKGFGIDYHHGDTWQWETLLETARECVSKVRAQVCPILLEIETYRLKAHSKGDDNRQHDEVAAYWAKDPLSRLIADDSDGSIAALDEDVEREISAAVADAEGAPRCFVAASSNDVEAAPLEWSRPKFSEQRITDAVHAALRRHLSANSGAVLLGEDIEGAYGGAFKITRDLSVDFPGRVRNTPISEAAITGVATGLALRGMRPVVEIMFGDFTTLILDQLLQHACKFRAMYGGGVSVPLTVRTPMGGRRGYGPTHSQSLEKHFLGVPNLAIVSINHRTPVLDIYERALEQHDPILIIENKIIYTRMLRPFAAPGFDLMLSNQSFPCVRISPADRAPQVTLLCHGGMLEEAEAAAQALFDEDEILVEIICPTLLQPFDPRPLADSVRVTGSLVSCEEGSSIAGFGSEALSRLSEFGAAPARFRKLGFDGVIPSAFEAEQEVLPGASHIASAVRALLS
jgi:2-oxoisovalerate dehydrogenase E1 component